MDCLFYQIVSIIQDRERELFYKKMGLKLSNIKKYITKIRISNNKKELENFKNLPDDEIFKIEVDKLEKALQWKN